MTDFEKAMKELANVEHSNDNSKVLHKNPTELGLTFWGIYQSANPNLPIWSIIDRYLKIEPDIKTTLDNIRGADYTRLLK